MKYIVATAVLVASLSFTVDVHAGMLNLQSTGRSGTAFLDNAKSLPNPAGSAASPVAVNEGFEQVDVLGGGGVGNE